MLANHDKVTKKVNALIKQFGISGAVERIKNRPATGLFSCYQNYPNGVFVYTDRHGVLVGSKS